MSRPFRGRQGGKFPLTTYLAQRVREMIAHPERVRNLPAQVAEWLNLQAWRSVLPAADEMLVETFPRNAKFHLVATPSTAASRTRRSACC